MSKENYINEIEKVAQSRWRRYIDEKVDKSPEGLSDFASESTRNRRQLFDKPGNHQDVNSMKELSEEDRIKYIKQKLSSKDGFGKNKPQKSRAILEEMKDDIHRRKRVIRSKMNKRKLDAEFLAEQSQQGKLNLSSSMDFAGSHKDAKPDDYIDIIHGGNRAKAEAFARNGNGASQMQTYEMLNNGKVTEEGLQFHSKNKERASGYANMASSSSGGNSAILKGKIKRKYAYPNSTQGNYSDEYGIPPEYFNKMEDVKVYNPETGKVYYERKGRSNALPHGRTTTPGAPTALEKAKASNKNRKDFAFSGEGNLVTGKDTISRPKKKIPVKAKPITENAIVPYGQTDIINKEKASPLTGMSEQQKILKQNTKNRVKEKAKAIEKARAKIRAKEMARNSHLLPTIPTSKNPTFNNISATSGMNEKQRLLKDQIKNNAKQKMKNKSLVLQNLSDTADKINKNTNKRHLGKLGAGLGLAGLGLGAGVGAYKLFNKERN